MGLQHIELICTVTHFTKELEGSTEPTWRQAGWNVKREKARLTEKQVINSKELK